MDPLPSISGTEGIEKNNTKRYQNCREINPLGVLTDQKTNAVLKDQAST